MPERRRRLRVVRHLRDHHPHPHAPARRGEDAVDHVTVRDVRVHHVEPGAGEVDLLADRLRGRDVATGDHLHESNARRTRVERLDEVACEVVGQRAPVPAEARQEGRLRLTHDVAGEASHDVVEAAVLEVILYPGPARPGHGAVDHVQLAVVGTPDLVLAPVDPLRRSGRGRPGRAERRR